MKDVKIYIASPYTHGWMPTMVSLQMKTADLLMDDGYLPYTPLLTHFQEIYSQRTEHEWLKVDFGFLKCCDAVLRLKPVDKKGNEIPSYGADQEVELAKSKGIPVFYSIDELNDHFKANSKQNELPYFDAEYLKNKYLEM